MGLGKPIKNYLMKTYTTNDMTKTKIDKQTRTEVMNNYGPRGLHQVYHLMKTTNWDMETIMETMTRWEDVLNDGYDLHESCVKVKKVQVDTTDRKGNDTVVNRTTGVNKEKRPTCRTLNVLHKHVRKKGNGLSGVTDGHRDEWTQERTMFDKHKTGIDPDDLVQQGMYHSWVREMRLLDKTNDQMEEGIKTLMECMGRYKTEYVREQNKVETNDSTPMKYVLDTVTRLYTRHKDRVLTDVRNKQLPVDEVEWDDVVDTYEGQTPVDEKTMEKLTKLLLGNMKEQDIDLWVMKTRGVSDKEIGEVLGTTHGYVRVKMNRMRKRLLKTLQDLGGMETITHMEV
jgi:hypothetical protein